MLSRGHLKMSDNENILTREVNSVLIKSNERQVSKNSEHQAKFDTDKFLKFRCYA
jgi:hypothetical protein